jgi:hypothetical protein
LISTFPTGQSLCPLSHALLGAVKNVHAILDFVHSVLEW